MTDDMPERSPSLWESIKKGLQDGAAVVMDRAEELTTQGRARLDVAASKARLTRLCAELGAEVFGQVVADAVADISASDAVASLCDQIRETKAELAANEKDLRELTTVPDDAAVDEAGSAE